MKRRDEEKSKLILSRASEDMLIDLIEKYPSPEELKGEQKFSKEHEEKMQRIIRKAQKRRKSSSGSLGGRLLRVGVGIAAAFGLICFVATIMAFTMPKTRIALQNYLLTDNGDHIDISLRPAEKEFEKEVYNYPLYIPDGFLLEDSDESPNHLMVFYANEEDKFFRLERLSDNAKIMINTENSESSVIDINGRKGQLVVREGWVVVFFSNSEYGFLLSTDISPEEAIKIMESISEKK